MVNKAVLLGNVGADPETKHLEGGTQFSKFSLATTHKYKLQSGEKKEETQWHTIIAWRGLSKVIESYVKKGDKIYIEGSISYRNFTDENGVKKFFTEIVATDLQMLGNKKQNQDNQEDVNGNTF